MNIPERKELLGEIDRKKEALIGEIEAKLKQSVKVEEIRTIRWRVR